MRTPAALFPFNPRLLPAVKLFEELQDKYTLRKLVSPPGLGLTGKDASYSRNHPQLGMTVTDILDVTDSTWDVLLLTSEPDAELIEDTKLATAAEHALRAGKSVLYFDYSRSGMPKKIRALSEAYPDMMNIFSGDKPIPANLGFDNDEYRQNNAPVVLVGGLVGEEDTCEVVLRLAARLRADGFFVTAITRQPLCHLWGLHTVNHIYDRNDLDEPQKILELNRFVRSIESAERPHIILIEAPDAVMRFNDIAPNGFGIRTYMLCQAVRPDYFVCCVPFELAASQFLDGISADFERRLGSPIHASHASNLVIDSIDLVQTRSVSYIHADLDMVRQQIAGTGEYLSIPLFDVVSYGVEGLHAHLCGVVLPEGRRKLH